MTKLNAMAPGELDQRAHRCTGLLLPGAYSLSALILLVPAYALPFMTIERMGHGHSDTIFTGVQKLWSQGMWGIALIVFVASLLVPILKLTSVAYLLWTARQGTLENPLLWHKLHSFVHFVGRWSMLDVFLVAFLCGIVRFDSLATVSAGPGALAFALAALLTMLSTSTLHAPLTAR